MKWVAGRLQRARDGCPLPWGNKKNELMALITLGFASSQTAVFLPRPPAQWQG